MKTRILLIVSLILNLGATAKERNFIEMQDIAFETMKMHAGISDEERGKYMVSTETANCCVLTSQSGGTVIIAKDDEVNTVLGYSTGHYDPQHVPCGFRWWLQAIDAALKEQKSGIRSQPQRSVPDNLPSSVSPILTCNWGQSYPYNQMCPNGTLVGCVAVAMGQVMSAHMHPDKGVGIHSYTTNGYGELSVNFGNTNYDWNKIKSNDYSEISKLLYHCGVSVNMNYGSSMSTASSGNVRNALTSRFRYKLCARYITRNGYSSESWMSILFGNLAEGLPLFYFGDSSDEVGAIGHAFVIDGYDSMGYVHVNWGWFGDMNGYYDLTYLGSYRYNQGMICDIVPFSDVTLGLDLGGGGVINHLVNLGHNYEFAFVPDEGYSIKSILYNNDDVTSQLVNGNTFITPSITTNSTLKVNVEHLIIGDVNYDGEVNIADVNAVIASILNDNSDPNLDCDVNGDGEINIADINTIINIILEPHTTVTVKTVQVGTGNQKQETEPITNWHMVSFQGHELLIHKNELDDMKKGDRIIALSYVCNGGYASGGFFNVRMKNVTFDQLTTIDDGEDSNTAISKIAVGYSEPVNCSTQLRSYGSGDTIVFNFTTPFVYDGNNIVIDIRNSQIGSCNGWVYFASSQSTYPRVLGWWGANSENITGFDYSYGDCAIYCSESGGYYPNVTITYESR